MKLMEAGYTADRFARAVVRDEVSYFISSSSSFGTKRYWLTCLPTYEP